MDYAFADDPGPALPTGDHPEGPALERLPPAGETGIAEPSG